MSAEENLVTVERFFQADVQNDLERYLGHFAADARADFSELDRPYGRVFDGHEQIEELFLEMNGPWREVRFRLSDPLAGADWVVVDAAREAHHADGFGVSSTATAAVRLSEGLIVYFKTFRERDDALAAAGLKA